MSLSTASTPVPRQDADRGWVCPLSMAGSLPILDTEDRAVAEDFARNDPFALNGVFEAVIVTPWRKTIWDKAQQG